MSAISTAFSFATTYVAPYITLGNSLGGLGLYALWTLKKNATPAIELCEALQGKNLEVHTKAPHYELLNLSQKLSEAEGKLATDPTESRKITENALASFFSHSNYRDLIESSEWLRQDKRSLLSALQGLYSSLNSASADISRTLPNCSLKVKKAISKQEGRLTKIKVATAEFFDWGVKHATTPSQNTNQSQKSNLHPVNKIRALLERPDSKMKTRLLKFQLEKLGLQATLDDLSNKLDSCVKSRVYRIQHDDPKGYQTACKKLNLDPNLIHTGNQSTIDRVLVTYDHYRKSNPILPPHSTLPETLRWNEKTDYQSERNKALDLASCFGVLIFFRLRYGEDEKSKKEFYEVLAKTHSLSTADRKKEIFKFFESTRERLGGAWLPWAADQYLFDSVFQKIKEVTSQFLSDTPVLENIRMELKDSPVPSMVYLGEKCSRYFHYLTSKYAEWSKKYTYDMEADRFLEKKLEKRQESAQGHLNLDFFLSRYNLVVNLQKLSDALSLWASRSCFKKDSLIGTLNPLIILIKQLLMLPPRLLAQLLKIPALFLQWGLDRLYLNVVEQILVHTKLIDKVDEVVTEALLKPSPYQFPFLEIVLKNLQEILATIKTDSVQKGPVHAQNDRAKRALQEAVRTFVAFAKTQESLDTTNDSSEQRLFEKILPFAMDKVFDTSLKIHGSYIEGNDYEKRKTEYLQALNFYVYKQYTPEEDAPLTARHEAVKDHIAIYARKIIEALVIQTSSEEISESLAKLIKKLFSEADGSSFSPLKQSYLNRKQALIVDVLKKSFVMKGLFLHLITEDRDL